MREPCLPRCRARSWNPSWTPSQGNVTPGVLKESVLDWCCFCWAPGARGHHSSAPDPVCLTCGLLAASHYRQDGGGGECAGSPGTWGQGKGAFLLAFSTPSGFTVTASACHKGPSPGCRLGRNNFDPQTAVDHLPVHIGKCVSPAGLMAVCDSLVSTRFPPMAGAWMLWAQRQAPPAALTCPLPLWPPTPESPPLTFPSPLVGLGPGLPSAFLTLDLRCAAQQKRPWFRAAVPEAIMAGR